MYVYVHTYNITNEKQENGLYKSRSGLSFAKETNEISK